MPRQLQRRVLELVETAFDTTLQHETCPDWLKRPGRDDCGPLWPTVQAIYTGLTGQELPDVMPPRERRSLDAVLTHRDGTRRVVEVDEAQHFTPARARTLALYPRDTATAFDRAVWAQRAASTIRLPGGGFSRPCPPLFPGPGGRHLQRAFRDALADLLPALHGWAPTLRLADFEVLDWLHADNATQQMEDLLAAKGIPLP